jgi:hypothetical protein
LGIPIKDAAAERELNEFAAAILTPDHRSWASARRAAGSADKVDSTLSPETCEFARAVFGISLRDAAAEQKLNEFAAAITSVSEGSWDSAKHPRGAFPQNRGWWSPSGGTGAATTKPDRTGMQRNATGDQVATPDMLELAHAWWQTNNVLQQSRRDIERLSTLVANQRAALASRDGRSHVHAHILAGAERDLERVTALVPQLEKQRHDLEQQYHDSGYDEVPYSAWTPGETLVGGRGIEKVGSAVGMGGTPAGLKPTGIEVDIALTAGGVLKLGRAILNRALSRVPTSVPLSTRVSQIHGVLDRIAQKQRTTTILETTDGTRIVATGGRDLTPAQKALLGPGDVGAKLPRAHAELTALAVR